MRRAVRLLSCKRTLFFSNCFPEELLAINFFETICLVQKLNLFGITVLAFVNYKLLITCHFNNWKNGGTNFNGKFSPAHVEQMRVMFWVVSFLLFKVRGSPSHYALGIYLMMQRSRLSSPAHGIMRLGPSPFLGKTSPISTGQEGESITREGSIRKDQVGRSSPPLPTGRWVPSVCLLLEGFLVR